MAMSRKTRKLISGLCILVGALCIIVPLGYEAVNYPWMTLFNPNANEIVLADAQEPEVEYINYRDISEQFREGSRGDLSQYGPSILPGSPEEETPPPEEVDPYTAYLEYANSTFILLGNLKIPRLNVSENLFEGTWGQLIVGVGHTPGTAMPGQPGNCVISGHRVHALYSGKQPFRYLDSLIPGDIITIDFDGALHTYEVYIQFIVEKTDLWVLYPLKEEPNALTLITCDPVIGGNDRPNRLIVRARLISSEPLELIDP